MADLRVGSTAIKDTNGLEFLKFVETASAVNEFTLTPATAGNHPTLSSSGDDTNPWIKFDPKGSGGIQHDCAKTAFNGAEGAAGAAVRFQKTLTALADNVDGTLLTLTIPNAIHGGALKITITGMLGDGDSTETKEYLISLSRIAGADTKRTLGTAYGTAQTTGATGNATVTVSLGTLSGAVGATQTLTILAKVARSAGASSNHVIVATVELLNGNATGITLA